MTDKETVAAVVVTYNRKDLLLQCLESLYLQSRRPDKILIIDNASTDGTRETLEERGVLQGELVQYTRLTENTGGAGGFHEGVKRGYELGYDRLWLMDDDCLPEATCLEVLMGNVEPNEVGAPWKLVTGTGAAVASSGTLDPNVSGKTRVYPLAFNGLLLSREAVGVIGLPRREFFLDKDDSEFTIRAEEAGFKCHLVIEARLYHPDNPVAEIDFFGKRVRVVNYAKGDRIFFRARNLVFLHRLHSRTYRTRTLLKAYLNEVIVLLFAEFSARRVWYFVKGIFAGVSSRLPADSIKVQ